MAIFLYIFVDAEDSGRDNGMMLVFSRAVDNVIKLGNDGVLDTGDAEMDGQSVDLSVQAFGRVSSMVEIGVAEEASKLL